MSIFCRALEHLHRSFVGAIPFLLSLNNLNGVGFKSKRKHNNTDACDAKHIVVLCDVPCSCGLNAWLSCWFVVLRGRMCFKCQWSLLCHGGSC